MKKLASQYKMYEWFWSTNEGYGWAMYVAVTESLEEALAMAVDELQGEELEYVRNHEPDRVCPLPATTCFWHSE